MPDTDPTPGSPVTVGDRVGWFRSDVAEQFTALGIKIDALGTKLDAIVTALTSASGNIDAAPIVDAITALRGSGPENTIHSVNQSLWAIAGPAPGTTLTDLYSLFNPGSGITPYNLLDSIYLAATAIHNHIGIPTGDATSTLLGLLAQVRFALTQPDSGNATVYAKIHSIMNAITLPANIDNTILGELEMIRSLSTTTNRILNPGGYVPLDVCATPYASEGSVFFASFIVAGVSILTPVNMATWPDGPPAGITTVEDVSAGHIGLAATDWAAWKIYVSSAATMFGMTRTAAQRLPTNKWVTLSGSDALRFFVDGTVSLKVYICQSSTIPPSTGLHVVLFTPDFGGRSYAVAASELAPLVGGTILTVVNTSSGWRYQTPNILVEGSLSGKTVTYNAAADNFGELWYRNLPIDSTAIFEVMTLPIGIPTAITVSMEHFALQSTSPDATFTIV